MKRAFAVLGAAVLVWACSGKKAADDDDSGSGGTTYDPSSYCGILQSRLRECGVLGAGRYHCENFGDDAEQCESSCVRDAECAGLEEFYCSFMGPVSRCFQECIGLATFTCDDGTVLSVNARCDGFGECLNLEDEADCTAVSGYRCRNVDQRVDFSLYCDGVPDCSDGSDETPGCAVELTCDDGVSVTGYQICDGIRYCTDGSDEASGCAVSTCGG